MLSCDCYLARQSLYPDVDIRIRGGVGLRRADGQQREVPRRRADWRGVAVEHAASHRASARRRNRYTRRVARDRAIRDINAAQDAGRRLLHAERAIEVQMAA